MWTEQKSYIQCCTFIEILKLSSYRHIPHYCWFREVCFQASKNTWIYSNGGILKSQKLSPPVTREVPGEHIPQAPVINQLINQRATKGTSHSPKHSNERIKCVDQTQKNRAHVINPYWLKTHKLNNDIELSFNKPETAQQIEWIKSHSPLLLQREFLDSVLQIMLLTVKQFSVSMHWCPQSIFYKPQFCEWPPEHLTQKILNAVCTLGRAHRSSTFRGEGSWVTEQHNSTNWTSSSWSSVGLQCSCVRLWQASEEGFFVCDTPFMIRSSIMRRNTNGSLPVRIRSGFICACFYFYCCPLFLRSRNSFVHHLQLSKLLV